MNDSADIQSVLDFWFAGSGAASPSAEDSKRWFGGGESLDQEIRGKFSPLLHRSLDTWLDSPPGFLAYVIVHDQFPLNMYRRQAKAFAFEDRAECAAQVALERLFDRGMAYSERVFLYMPLMHAEKLVLQDLGVAMFKRLAEEVPEPLRDSARGNLKFAQEHRNTIATFGRFPFRNEVLGRQNTAAEELYLSAGAPRYGQ